MQLLFYANKDMLCYVMICYLCYAMSCYVILRHTFIYSFLSYGIYSFKLRQQNANFDLNCVDFLSHVVLALVYYYTSVILLQNLL